jgi:diguanylate cyclase (GGDEF)-like protein
MPQGKLRILLVDDDEEEYLLVHSLLSDLALRSSFYTYSLEWVGTYEEGLEALKHKHFDVYLIDYRLDERTGLDLLSETGAHNLAAPVIILTGHGSYDIDLEAMRVGATDYISKNELSPALLERTIRYAIESKRAEENARRNAARSARLASLSHAIAEAGLEYPKVACEIVERISEAVHDPCFIFLKEAGHSCLRHKDPRLQQAAHKFLALIQSSSFLQLLQPEKPQHLSGIHQMLSQEQELSLEQDRILKRFRSLILVPLLVRGESVGTFGALRSSHSPAYTSEDLDFYSSVGDRVALAVENARLYANAQQRAVELDALHKATAALLTTLDLDELLGQILDAAQSAFPAADKGLLHLVAPGTSELKMRAISGFKDPRIKKVVFPKGTDYPSTVLREKKPVLIDDMEDTTSRPDSLPFRSAIIVPLFHGVSVHGVLTLSSSVPFAFTPHDLHLLETFAATTTAALQNALLHAEVQKLAITDSLTGYMNRRGFDDLSARELERALRFGRPLSLIMIDIDNFKKINDTYGHAVGDRVLYHLAGRLQSSLREVDVLGRYGGDEFIVLLPETDAETASAVAERIRIEFYRPLSIGKTLPPEKPLIVSASFGVAGLTNDIQDIASLVEKADRAAYRAKQNGRNLVEVA